MARPKPSLPDARAVQMLIDADGRLAVRVTPAAKVEMLEIADGKLIAKVRAKPQDGAANAAVQAIIAAALGIAPSRVELLRGATSREKQFGIAL